MATQNKLTVSLGGYRLQDVTVGAGTTTTDGDTLELNIDQNKMTKGDCLQLLDKLRQKVFNSKWPLS